MEQWVLLRKGADFAKIAEKFHISPRLAALIRNRDVVGDEAIDKYLNGTLADLEDGMLMKDMDRTIEILKEKISEGQKIRIIGDYDIDGINATYILLEGLEGLGADVDSDIPDRIADGYGLSMDLIERAYEAKVDTIITCDNGIAASEEIAYGKRLGMTMLVTDHHEVPYEMEDEEKIYHLPLADAVIDPKRQDCEYPFKELCGAAVAYKLVEALYEASGRDSEDIDYLLENVAIATVGDVMDLVGENRIFVREGLEMLGRTENLGLRALMDATGIDKDKIKSYHIGFVLGPCLNASGRLDTAKRALELLRAKTKKEADLLAGDLKALNDSRKDMTTNAVEKAVKQVEETSIGKGTVLVIYLPDCHESLAGIVAGRIRERYYKPAIVLTEAQDGVKGSGRSIPSYHMFEGLSRCKYLLTRFGGHKLAAGLSLEEENIDALREALNEECNLTKDDLTEKISIDMELPFSCVEEGFVEELRRLEPLGKGNTKPIFAARNVELLKARIMGKNQNVLKFQAKDKSGAVLDALYFGDIQKLLSTLEGRYGKQRTDALMQGRGSQMFLSVTYDPDINEYMGRKTPQIIITHYL